MRPATVMSNPISQTFHHAKTRSYTPGLTRFSTSRKHARNASQLDSYIAPLAGIHHSQFPPKESERREITGHMGALKKIFNSFREDYEKADKKLEALNSQFSQYNTIEEISGLRAARQEGKIKSLKKKTEETQRLQIEENFNRQVNLHVLERMRQTKIHMDFKKNSMKEQIKVLDYYLRDEQRKQLTSRDGQFKGIFAFKSLQQSVNDEQKAHNLQLEMIEKEYKYTKKANNKREDRKHRQEEIAEAAANEDRDLRYNKTREALMLNKLWYKYLGNALKIQMEQSKSIEEAFQKIRVVTGLYDIQEVVQRFLTREQSYAQLATMVTECKAICNNYKNKNTELSDLIHEFKLAEQTNKNVNTEILKNKIADCYEDLTKEKDKYFRSKKTRTNILLWAKKMLMKFNKGHTDQKNEDIKEVMQSLANEVKFAIQKTKELGAPLNIAKKESLSEIQGIFKRLNPELQVKMMRIDPEEILKKEASVEDLAPASYSPEIVEEIPDKKYKLHPFVPEKENSSSFRHSKYDKHK
ncbi:unnamed protein product [Blepharisma stoltei]|uniref:Uncharacterized protein n=1 Tax=Blepharisma stoltei TaxID=1481888 RepID=A0AAU9IIQ4_9CILI|nr:unnamed protein product [Blepharisma stoltei]